MENSAQEKQSFGSAVVAELSRRKVTRTVGAYAVAVFALLQLMDAAVEPLRLPDWLPTLLVIGLILGFPIVFILAWQFQITPQGIRRTAASGSLTKSRSTTLFTVTMLVTAALGYGFYAYYAGDDAAAPEAEVAERSFSAPQNSIAVLPFADLSQGADQGYFADGLSEELLNLLAQVPGLHVAARTSSFAFREPQKDIREVGRLLNVRTVLEGSIRTAGNRIRLTAQLINVEDGFHIWSQTYDREMADIFTLQDEVASQIAESLVESFDGLEPREANRSDNMAAAQAYRTGRLMWWRRTPEDLKGAIELFATALQHDPKYAAAYAAMADTWLLLSLYGDVSPFEAIESAMPMIDRALAMDPESAEGFAALGLARSELGQRDAAESALRHAIELNANYVPAHLWLSSVLETQGRYPEQLRVLEAAIALDPLNELLATHYAGNLAIRGEWNRAREMISELISVKPDSNMLLRFQATNEFFHGQLVEGFRLAHKSYTLQPNDPTDIATLAMSWMKLGGTEEAERLLADGVERFSNNFKLQELYWQLLLVTGRMEEARSLVTQWRQAAGENIPEVMERAFNFQLGMISMLEGDLVAGRNHMVQAIDAQQAGAYDRWQLFIVTMAAYACQQTGEMAEYERLMAEATREVQRARVNGVDDPEIYYTETVLLSIRGEVEPALEKLQLAYDRGFRELWVFEVDRRLDVLRDEPAFVKVRERIEEEVTAALIEVRQVSVASL